MLTVAALVLTMLSASPADATTAVATASGAVATTTAAPQAASEPPSAVTLTVDRTTIALGQSAVLTAAVDQPLEATSSTLTIWDTSNNVQLRSCASGATCTSTVTFTTGGPRTYEARVNGLISSTVSVARAAWTVALESDTVSIDAGKSVLLTATPNQNIKASAYRVEFVDVTTGASLGYCAPSTNWYASWNGSACTLSAAFATGPAHTYRAYVLSSYGGGGPVDSQAVSNDVVVQRSPWSVDLTTDKTEFAAGQSVLLTATPNQNIKASAYRVEFVDVTTGVSLGYCTPNQNWYASWTGTACTTSTTFTNGPAHTYRAYVLSSYGTSGPVDLQATSNDVVVQRSPWSVELVVDKAEFTAGQNFKLSATPNQDIHRTSGYRLYIVDETTGTELGHCGSNQDWNAGWSNGTCFTSTSFQSGAPHVYRAYVAVNHTGTTATDQQAVSNPVTVTRAAWAVGLTIDKPVFNAGERVRLTATPNQDIHLTSGYRLYIVDETTGTELGHCGSNQDWNASWSNGSCSTSTGFQSGAPHTYRAYVAVNHTGATVTDPQAVSNVVIATRAAWSVGLTIDNPVFTAGQNVRITATPNQDIHLTSGYRLYIVDETTGKELGHCGSTQDWLATWFGGTCTVTTSFKTGPAHSYRAYVAVDHNGTVATDQQAVSNYVTATRAAWSVALTIDRPVFSTGQYVTLTATPNQDIQLSGYRLYIVDETTGVDVGSCGNSSNWSAGWYGGACTTSTSYLVGPAHTYRAYIATNFTNAAPTDAQALSNTVTATRAAWTVTLQSTITVNDYGQQVVLVATPNQDPTYWQGYVLLFGDVTTGQIVGGCGYGSNYWYNGKCTYSQFYSGDRRPRSFLAYIARSGSTISSLTDIQAISNGFSATNVGGPTLPGENAAGSNPSEECPQGCHGDPVNSFSGEFWESLTDLDVPGIGPALAWTRSYGTTRASQDGPLGRGWSSSYGLRLAPDGGTDLSTAPWIQVVQENGSAVLFTTNGLGGYTAPSRVLASLERMSDGTFVFTRRQQQRFTFDAHGRLTALADRNGNTATLTYEGARLAQVANGRGQYLALTWSGDRIVAVKDHTGREATYTYSSAGDLTSVVGPAGTTSYTYDAAHRIVTLTDAAGGVTTNVYDGSNRVTKQTDPIGRATSFAYSPGQTTITAPDGLVTVEKYTDARLTSVIKGFGTTLAQTSTYVYGATNQVESSADALGRVTRFTYDAYGNRTSVTDPLGRKATSTFDAFGNPLVVTNAAGEKTTFVYDERGNLVSSTGPDGATTTVVVNVDGTAAAVTDALERTTSMTYDAHGNPQSTTTADGAVATSAYDSLGRLQSTTSPLGNAPGAVAADYTSTFTYDSAGRQLSGSDPLGATSEVSYDAAGRPLTVTDPAGAVTRTEYDRAGQVVAVVDADGNRSSFTYDGAGRVLTATDANGETTSRAYDALGRLTSVTDPLGRVARIEYDAGNRVTATVAPSGARTIYAYDAADQLLSTTDALGHSSSTTYDQAGRPLTVTDADGRVVTTSYDAAGRATQLLRGDGSALGWQYDAAGQLLHATDAAGASTTYVYDAAGRATSFTDTAGRVTAYGYDAEGNLVRTTQPGGAVTTYSYDRAGRRIGTDYSDATPDVAATYDLAGRLAQVTNGASATTYARDVLGRVTEVSRNGSTVGYAYDDLSRLTRVTYPNGQQVDRAYDTAGQLKKVTDWAGREFTYTYAADGQVDELTYPNGVVTTYDHDASGKTLGITSQNDAGHDLLDLAYGYTDAGLLADQDVTRPGTPRGPPVTDSSVASDYRWDPLGRLAEVTGTGAGILTFDAAGSVTALPDGRNLTYDARRQLTTLADASTGTTSTYGYDERGNRVTASSRLGDGSTLDVTHVFDEANRLTTITTAGVTTNYTYDAAGLRTSATTGTSVEEYAWDTLASVPLLLTDASHAYVYGVGTVPLEQVDTATGAVDYLHADLLGSVRTTTDATGQVTADSDYDSYGRPQSTAGVRPVDEITRFGYAGEYSDPTGYLYLRGRYYDPDSAQFISVDALLQATGDPYGYAAGNPLQYTDPLGLDAWQDAGDWTAAFGDTLTFGGTKQIRILMGVDDAVDYCSDFYEWGGNGGLAASFIPIGGGGFATIARFARRAPGAAALTIQLSRIANTTVGTAVRAASNWVSRTKSVSIERVQAAARALADSMPRPPRAGDPRTATVVGTKSGALYPGTSGSGVRPHSTVQEALDAVPEADRSVFHGECGEIECLSRALEAGDDVAGGFSSSARIRGPNSSAHGSSIPPCSSCAAVLDALGVRY